MENFTNTLAAIIVYGFALSLDPAALLNVNRSRNSRSMTFTELNPALSHCRQSCAMSGYLSIDSASLVERCRSSAQIRLVS